MKTVLCILCWLCLHMSLAAPPTLNVPFAAQTPAVTARADDPAWADAARIPALTISRGPDGQGLTPLPTTVQAMWDAQFLYLRFSCRDTEIYSPFMAHDDPVYKGDAVEVFLDPVGDARQYVELEISPHNVVFDQLFTLTATPRSGPDGKLLDGVLARDWWPDLSWTMDGLRTAAFIDTDAAGRTTGWRVDMAVPVAALLHRLGRQTFSPSLHLRANFLRYEWPVSSTPNAPRRLMAMNWASVLYGCPHISPQAMGTLVLQRTSLSPVVWKQKSGLTSVP